MREQDLLQSGGFGQSTNSARAGFLPIALAQLPVGALRGIGVHLRVRRPQADAVAAAGGGGTEAQGFQLYCAEEIRFTDKHRQTLLEHGVRFVYIRMQDQSRFRRQTESQLRQIAGDPARAIAERSTIVYETSVELINELLAEPDLMRQQPRLEQVSRAVTTLVMNDPAAFSHLFAASHHDFYTATHMVNVATWMVPLAYELGHKDVDVLNAVCQAGMLHDMGKTAVPEDVLNKPGALGEAEWATIKRHPEAGHEYLSKFADIDPLVLRVTLEHHERIDGTGYPRGRTGEQMHPVSRICAVVDSFDAMTAFRPFKERTLSVPQALDILKRESGIKYDPEVVAAWTKLMSRAVEEAGSPDISCVGAAVREQTLRTHQRQAFNCPGRVHGLDVGAAVTERPGVPIVAHNISKAGLGFLCQTPLLPGTPVRVYLQAKGWEKRALDGETVRCRTHSDRWHEVGMRFGPVQAVTPEVPAAMPAPAAPVPAAAA